MTLTIAILAYAAAMIAANLSVATFGPAISPLNAFLLIGLDLSLRDWLHVRLKPLQMLALIVATGAATYFRTRQRGSSRSPARRHSPRPRSLTGSPSLDCEDPGGSEPTVRTSPAPRSTR